MEGWISLYRKFINWEWYTDANTMRLFIHLLLLANHQDNKWRGKEVKRGQLITSIKHLSEDLKLTPKQIRLSLEKLKSTQEIATKGANKYTVITIEKYELYQDSEEKRASKRANEGQTKGKQRATNNNDNNGDNENKINSSSCSMEIFELYEENIGTLSPIIVQDLEAYLEKLDPELIKKAIEISVKANKRNMRYISGILNNWQSKGYKKVVDIEDYKEKQKEDNFDERVRQLKERIRKREEENSK